VELVRGDNDVRGFVVQHHYAHAFPNSGRFRFALREGNDLVGVAVFGVPAGPKVLASSFPFLSTPSQESVELQRLVLLDEVLKNGESWFVARCFKVLRAEGVEACVSFSDPTQGHVGTVYQSLNAHHTGRSKAAWSWRLLADGYRINRRDITKIQQSCTCCGTGRSTGGADGAMVRFVSWGARLPRSGECRRAWINEILPTIAVRRKHPGNHRYTWGLSKGSKRGLRRIHGPVDATRYPKVGV
jgi:hypothetical protein